MTIRSARKEDIDSIIELVQELADHEKYTGPIASKEYLVSSFFNEPSPIDIHVIEVDGHIIGMGHTMIFPSTFSGKHQLFLQDFIIREEFRGKGYGKEFIKYISKIALERNCGKITWNFFAWNEPAAGFYKTIGEITEQIENCSLDEHRMRQLLNEQ